MPSACAHTPPSPSRRDCAGTAMVWVTRRINALTRASPRSRPSRMALPARCLWSTTRATRLSAADSGRGRRRSPLRASSTRTNSSHSPSGEVPGRGHLLVRHPRRRRHRRRDHPWHRVQPRRPDRRLRGFPHRRRRRRCLGRGHSLPLIRQCRRNTRRGLRSMRPRSRLQVLLTRLTNSFEGKFTRRKFWYAKSP